MRFQDSWLDEPALRDWLVKVSNDESRAYCRCCGIILRAHKADLVTHASTARHGKNAENSSLAGISGALNVQIVTGEEQVMQGTIIGQSRTSGFHDLGYQTFQRAPNSKRFRPEWQEIDELKDWLEPCQEDNTKAYCKMCAVQLRAHKHDLLLHGRSTKHKRCSQAATANVQQNAGASNPNVMSVEYETTVAHSDMVPNAIVDTIVQTVDEEPVMKKSRTLVEEVETAEDVMQNLQSDSDGGASGAIMAEVRNGTNQDVHGSGDEDQNDIKAPQISIIRVLDSKPKTSTLTFSSDNSFRTGTAPSPSVRRRRGRVSAADVIRAIDLNEFTGYEMLHILKRIVPKL